MAKEMILVTMESVNGLSNADLKRELKSYMQAGASIGNARWQMAEAIYNVMNDELFDEDFESETEFYDFINLKKSNGSQLINAVKFMKREGFDYGAYSVGKAYALSTLSQEEFYEFMDYCNSVDKCTHAMTDKALVELIKTWKMSKLEVIEAEETEDGETTIDELEPKSLKEQAIEEIKRLMEKYNISIDEL